MTTPSFTIAKTAAGYHITVECSGASTVTTHAGSIGEAVDVAFGSTLYAPAADIALIRETIETHFRSTPCELVDAERAVEDGGFDLHFYFGGFATDAYNVNIGDIAPI